MTIGSKTIDVELNHDELVALLGAPAGAGLGGVAKCLTSPCCAKKPDPPLKRGICQGASRITRGAVLA